MVRIIYDDKLIICCIIKAVSRRWRRLRRHLVAHLAGGGARAAHVGGAWRPRPGQGAQVPQRGGRGGRARRLDRDHGQRQVGPRTNYDQLLLISLLLIIMNINNDKLMKDGDCGGEGGVGARPAVRDRGREAGERHRVPHGRHRLRDLPLRRDGQVNIGTYINLLR